MFGTGLAQTGPQAQTSAGQDDEAGQAGACTGLMKAAESRVFMQVIHHGQRKSGG